MRCAKSAHGASHRSPTALAEIPPLMELKAIIFDYGGVLCFHPPEEQVRDLAEICRLQPDHFLKAYWSLRPAYDRGDLTATEYWKAIGSSAGIDYTADEILTLR